MPPWQPEDIPDPNRLFLRVHRDQARVALAPNVFVEHSGGMSTDWERYAIPETTRASGRKHSGEYGIVVLVAGAVRSVPGLSVEHTPEDANRAHTDVRGIGETGPQTTERRHLLFEKFDKRWLIEPDHED